ncbi:hypothetical protein ACFOZ0_08045 [Streptomyces yaanensis]|uniref:Uncharacterized protein n=1 Tax=Streptomyces yaanensis TaxID=1142239 RepID=A0ABV7S874_9ACTN|nr:hypothetical protein [Streptomyces sp. CGMCC 4.7035]WNC02728.1 hypothetical protein Q2K21_34310 [Streptomyces sp. CGMCC 4.7035]
MITQILHEATAPFGPAGVSLALAVAYELHAPAVQTPEDFELRAPERRALEVAVPQLMGLRTTAARPHRRKVPLNRLTLALG